MDRAILDILIQAARTHTDWAKHVETDRQIHLAVMNEPFLSGVLTGKKTIESRFSMRKVSPYKKVRPKDLIFMKNGPVVGMFEAEWVRDVDLSSEPIDLVKATYASKIGAGETFWNTKKDKRYLTLIGVTNAVSLTPVAVPKTDRRAWITLS